MKFITRSPFQEAIESSAAPVDTTGLPEPANQKTERWEKSQTIKKSLRALADKKDFEGLEKMAGKLIDSAEQYTTGVWQLDSFGYDIGHLDKEDDTSYKERIALLEAWARSNPDSIYAPVAVAEAYTGYAWYARGGGWGSEVEKDAWKLFKERLAKAREWLEKGREKRLENPRWYAAASTVALGQSWEQAEYEKTMDEGEKTFPSYNQIYFDRVYHLQPRWYGKEGDWERYAEKVADRLGGQEGDVLYARIVWYVDRARVLYKNNTIFRESKASWERTSRGFDGLLSLYPDNPDVLNAYCRLAVAAGNQARARELFEKIGSRMVYEPWAASEDSAGTYFIKCRIWAFGKR
ncbi:MAG: DUF4034 domain-containing protein [Candidatus Melainabacteria bacterium]|nr:DUF4034 domain-containing protein [Candidatus Melainabacteria bacterium]